MESQQIFSRTAVIGKAAVSTARRASADAALAMLEKGGNAVDAGVAAAFVAGVIEPMETTLAGSGFMLLSLPDGTVHSIEFGPRAPAGAHATMFKIDEHRQLDRGLGVSTVVDDLNVQGALAAGVPATLRGLIDAHERFGKLPLATVLNPAIAAAADGFSADTYFSLEVLDSLAALRADKGASNLFLVNGLPPAPAHLGAATLGKPSHITQTALAETLQRVAQEGVNAFYTGSLGDAFLATHQELGGLLSSEDLKAVRTTIASPRHLRFRDHDVWVPKAPSGALTQLQILTIWQKLYPDNPPVQDTAKRLADLASASWHAFADRYHWLGDPEFVPVPEQGLLSDAYAQQIAQHIRSGQLPPRCPSSTETPWNYFASHAAHDPWLHEENGTDKRVQWSPGASTEPTAGTTHISVIDEQGMSVSITHTAANHFGAKVVCERTGLLLDGAMGWFNARPNAANSIASAKRPLANMGPMMLTRNGAPVAAIGAPGGRRIINAVVQIALNLVERGMNATEACSAPRIDASGTSLLMSERLAQVMPHMGVFAADAKLVAEQHQGYSYELARPVVVACKDGLAHASTDPYSQGHSRSHV